MFFINFYLFSIPKINKKITRIKKIQGKNPKFSKIEFK